MSINNKDEQKESNVNLEKINLINPHILSKSESDEFYSVIFSPFLNLIYLFINYKEKIFKYILIFFLSIYFIIDFRFDDILPYEIKQDNYYKEILNEISNKNNSEIFEFTEFGITKTFLTQQTINKFNSFIEICLNSTLIDPKKYPLLPNPKISVIMPLYKGGKYLYYSLRSIQNQRMKDIEIIFIDDNSPDDTISIVENYMKEDPRIRLIKNELNRKILYSKSLAALNSKGKYIIQLDQDDIFIRDDVFDILYSAAEKEEFDLVQIRDITKNNFHLNKKTIVNCKRKHFIYPKNTQNKIQPDLKDTLFIQNNVFLLWGMLIKTEIYKKAVYHLWVIIINYDIVFHEDYTISFMIVILSKKFKYLNKFALIHLNHINSASNNHWDNKDYFLGVIFFANNLYDFYIKNHPKDIKLAINYLLLFVESFERGIKFYPYIFKLFINKILNNKYLAQSDREYIENEYQINNSSNFHLDLIEYKSILDFHNLILNSTGEITNITNNPKISIVITFNEIKFFEKTINSILNQNFKNFEIIVVYDNNINQNLTIIQNYVRNYPNIIFIHNNENKGFLYSIYRGVQITNGDYILILEPGYTLARESTLNELYKNISNDNVDILEFNLLKNYNDKYIYNGISLYRCEHFNTEAEEDLNKMKFNEQYRDIDQEKELLVNKLIKGNLLRNFLEESKLNEYKEKIYYYYNEILLFILFRIHAEFRRTDILGIIQNINDFEEINKERNMIFKDYKVNNTIFYINFLFDKTDESFEDKLKAANEFNNLLSVIYNKFTRISKESKKLYEKFINCSYVSQYYKNMFQFYYNSLLN